MRIVSVVGARPNFMKLAPVHRELARRAGVEHIVVHTGQHHDPGMSDAFFHDLHIPRPVHNLEVGSGTHAQQTANTMLRLEPILTVARPDMVLVYGDINSTAAAALVATKLGLRVGHVEAGLRSGDWSLPEEINRVVTDRVSDLLFAPSRDAVDNLRAEGIPHGRIHFAGNVMIDSLCWALPRAREANARSHFGLGGKPYVVTTLHRPANVDDPGTLREILEALAVVSRHLPVLFPVHPRTRDQVGRLGIAKWGNDVRLHEPLGYIEMLGLVAGARLVITDSGGLQEETTFLGVPCLTVRPNTERPITCVEGTNRLVAPDRTALLAAALSRVEQPTGPAPRSSAGTARRHGGS